AHRCGAAGRGDGGGHRGGPAPGASAGARGRRGRGRGGGGFRALGRGGVGVVRARGAASGWPPPGLVVVACDVGQGDAIVLPDGPGAAVLVDTGPDPSPVDGCLRRLHIDVVTLLVITHFHVDHIGGLGG